MNDERVFVFGPLLVDDAHIQPSPVTLAGKSSHVISGDGFALGHRVSYAAKSLAERAVALIESLQHLITGMPDRVVLVEAQYLLRSLIPVDNFQVPVDRKGAVSSALK
jgi:hypothetical protein